jgi:hypothetical protein
MKYFLLIALLFCFATGRMQTAQAAEGSGLIHTWNLTSTMTATLDVDKGALTIKTTKAGGERMPNYDGYYYDDYRDPPWSTFRPIIVSASIEDGVTAIGEYVFYRFLYLSSITIPNSVTTIGERAFANCSNLSSVTIPNSVTTIGEKAFAACGNLSSVTIPNSVTTIGDDAFLYCPMLKDVTVGWTIPVDYDWANCGAGEATLHVPAGTKSIYQAADGWNSFGTIVEYSHSPVGNEQISNPEIMAYIADHTLYINTSLLDVLSIYTAAGVKVYESPVPAGASTISTATLPQGMLILKGKSGWVKKVVN